MRKRFDRDVVASSALALLFSLALGMSSVALPLLALADGYGPSEVGLMVTLSAVVQIAARANLGAVMRRVPDRTLLAVAAGALMTSFLAVVVSSSLVGLGSAWALQGLGRACFWTCGQTHVVRAGGSSVGALAVLNLFGGVGLLVGPLVAGLLAESGARAALVAGAVVCAAAIVPTVALDRLPPFQRVEHSTLPRMWRRPGVDAACWAGVGAGAWRSLMDSFVPVILAAAEHSAATIGALVSVANGASILGAVIIGRMRPALTALCYAVSTLGAALGLAAFCLVAEAVAAAAAALAVSGLAAGVLQTLGPALAATSVYHEERGEAIAVAGTFRTIAMFVAPLSVAAAAVAVPVTAGMVALGVALCVPTLAARSLVRRDGE